MSNKNLPRVFIINLKQDTDRKNYMINLCDKYNLKYEFIEAINGNTLSEEEIDQVYSKKETVKNMGRELARAEIGCLLSHRKVYKKILTDNIDIALILEDDVIFDENLMRTLERIVKFPKNWELILLGHHSMRDRKRKTNRSLWGRKRIYLKYHIVRFCELAAGTYGYLINTKGAEKLYVKLRKIVQPIDHYTGNSNFINLYGTEPVLIRINTYFDKNTNNMGERTYLQEKYYKMKKNKKTLKKLFLEYIGLYDLTFKIYKEIQDFYQRLKPLKKYKE